MQPEESWPYLLQSRVSEHNITIINASISGDTAGNGADRLPALLDNHQPHYVLIALGANDGLRGFPPAKTRQHLQTMIQASQQAGAQVLLMQIRVPPNYGQRYSQLFEAIYPDLSVEFNIPLLPFFLEAIIENPAYMMQDGIHPNPSAQPLIRDLLYDALQPLFEQTLLTQ